MNYNKKGISSVAASQCIEQGKQEFQSLLKENPVKVDKDAELQFYACPQIISSKA